MKLSVRICESAAEPSSMVFLLCDEHGTPLPRQRLVTITQEAGKATVVTVEFVVDGYEIVVGGEVGRS